MAAWVSRRTSAHAREGELGVEAGDGFELVECAAGVAEGAAGDHGDGDAGRELEAGGGEDGGDEEGGLVADAAGGVLVDGEGVERCGVEGFAGEAHGVGEGGELVRREAALEDGHEERGDLGVGDFVSGVECGGGLVVLVASCASPLRTTAWTKCSISARESSWPSRFLMMMSRGWMGHEVLLCGALTLWMRESRRKAAGRRAARVVSSVAGVAGVEDEGGVVAELGEGLAAGSAGLEAALLRLATATARRRMVGPCTATARAMAACSAQVVRR